MRITRGVRAARSAIYALLPPDWTFFGPIREVDGTWTVGVRPVHAVVDHLETMTANDEDLYLALDQLEGGIDAMGLQPRGLN